MLDITALLNEIKKAPYTDISIRAPHTGVLTFSDLEEGAAISPPTGEWKEVPGTLLATITREHNPKPINSTQKGILQKIRTEYNNTFVEAGTEIAVLRHYLSKNEVVHILLQKALYLFNAPERAKYYFVPEVDKKVKISGSKNTSVTNGMELFIVSRMKREIPLKYQGPDGIIFELYFQQNQNVDAGMPLIGVCPPDQLEAIEGVIQQVAREWKVEF